jgi:hypothetical protein
MASVLARLRDGESIDLKSLERHHSNAKPTCADCEAAGVCRAAESVARDEGTSR